MSLVLYNDGRWDGIWDKPKYQEIRDKIKESFKDLIFIEEGHKYFLRGKRMTCVSDVTHLFKEHFDSEKMAEETSKRHFNNINSKYYKKSPQEILKMWTDNSKQACETGSERHLFGESCFYFMTRQFDKIIPEFKDRITEDGGFLAIFPKEEAIVHFWQDIPRCFVPIAAENLTFREDLNYSGTFDLLFYYEKELNENKTATRESGAVIFDYKTNVDLYKNFQGKKMLYPFEDLLEMDMSVYTIQLAAYQLALEKIGIPVIERRLIWLKPSGIYEKVKLTDVSKTLEKYLIDFPIS